jgi:uncharacterized damage-inducible protein DinB
MDIKETTLKSLHRSFSFFLKDLENLPEDVFSRSLGGKARTVADIVHEVNLTNDALRLSLLGAPVFDWPKGWVLAPEAVRAKDIVIQSFRTSSEQVIQTVAQMSLEDLEATIQTDYEEATRAEHCRSMMVHLWYHSGQLNFIQTLLGDEASHWS